ncbi:unconventional myosin-XVIIIa isoform X3 [Neodiprion fabricii]|uniref:unconventional myosin-XVIIIa isoform X3 n=1 Tax=Neodiprion fabricii TaxID=2872261 RepID=UPI001ED9304E|nr:unconventional myosin-XVIIIa isoform X3 [Neodiprion fabricii]
MASAKGVCIPKSTNGVGLQKFYNNPNWSPSGPQRLAKARSTSNIAKQISLPVTNSQTQRQDKNGVGNTASKRHSINGPPNNRSSPAGAVTNKSARCSTSSAKSAAPNVTVIQISGSDTGLATNNSAGNPVPAVRSNVSGKPRPSLSRLSRSSLSLSPMKSEPKNKTNKKEKENSCTILEDRALLKKGLLPKKPDALQRKGLNRSTSLWNVPVDSTQQQNTPSKNRHSIHEGSKSNAIGSAGKNENRGILNRTTSLWSVPCAAGSGKMSRAKSVSGLRPSRIPLFTQHLSTPTAANCSLVDLSRVDRNAEVSTSKKVEDCDELDRSVDEHIYQNCQDAAVKRVDPIYQNCRTNLPSPTKNLPIYENLKGQGALLERIDSLKEQTPNDKNVPAKKELLRTKSVPLEVHDSVDLEKRVKQLMAELDEDNDNKSSKSVKRDLKIDLETCRANLAKSKQVLSRSRDNLNRSREELARSKENLSRSQETLERSRGFAKSHESLLRRGEPETNIQEIRRNWENQIKKSQEMSESPMTKNKPSPKPRINTNTVNLSKKPPPVPVATDALLEAKRVNGAKRVKDIEHLVNFFNCKNTTEVVQQSPGAKDIIVTNEWNKEGSVAASPAADENNKDMSKKDKNGYMSDDNCSEDSGHMSNENDAEWKDRNEELKKFNKSEDFLKGIIQDLDTSLERTIEVFNATPIVQRFIPTAEKKSARKSLSISSGASSIESWEDAKSQSPRSSSESESWKTAATKKMSPASPIIPLAERQQVTIKTTRYRTQIFFRSGALEQLESQRDEKLTGHVILLQARCRGYLARRKLNTLKLQDMAVRCIQRNVRKLMSVREWPWWRLYVKVAPLLNVHRTEDQLKARTEELEVLRAKVERLEQERNHLKHDNDKLENKLSEITADFAEEHSTSTLAAERIDAETSERLRLERELQDVTQENKNLQQTTERLEMELLYARAADLNGVASDGEDGDEGGVYKQRYEHAVRELEFTKRKMAQQHEDDLEQLVGLKKQLEKKLADAYEEVEEQRQVVGQWKRRVQKLNGEMHDLRLLLEEQTARNNLLEKKQRKFDSETQNLMDDLRQEKTLRERITREKELAIAEKFTIEQNLSDARLEIELKEERLHSLTQELEDLTFGGKTEEEVAQLKKAKHELEKKTKDQEEELDDFAGQVQLLEQAKLRLEMSIEQQRKEMRKEMQQRDEELEEVRGNAHKKLKALEAQLETEHEERTILLREKHDLERRLVAFEEQDRTDRATDAENMQRLKRDLKRTRALLRDAQTMLERTKGDSAGKAALRQLKNQLEDAECARAVAIKAKQALELELNETQAALEEASRLRSEADERANVASRERAELRSQLEENEEELAEVLKKYRAVVQQVSAEQAQLQDSQAQVVALEAERSSLKDQLTELSQRLESVEQLGDPTANSLATRRLEFRTKELESKLELEQTTRARLETQIARLKENVDKLQTEAALLRTKEQTAQDAARRLQRSLRESRDEASSAVAREHETMRARRDLEKTLEAAEAETKVARDDLRLALQRIDDLQSAIQGELDLDCSEEATTDNSDSD